MMLQSDRQANQLAEQQAKLLGTNDKCFLFASAYKAIEAKGIYAKVTTPAIDGVEPDGKFQQQIKASFERAKASGIEKPMMIGAIPFDVRQDSCLYIPESYEFYKQTSSINEKERGLAIKVPLEILNIKSIPEERRFKQAVEQAIANFKHSDIRKAVLSRVLELKLGQDVNIDAIFNSLIQQNSAAYHFRVPMLEGSELIGASPELLVRKEGGLIVSNPLAGSAKRQADAQQDSVVSKALFQSEKDRYEHKLVIDEINAILKPYCSKLNVPDGPELINTPAMWHLSTTISGHLNNPLTSVLQLACALHPTPAVCGSPTVDAHKLINLVESFDRGLFTGLVGWCDDQGNGEWVVTIRCGTVKDDQIRLFAGAGIVNDSDPESEWLETQAKLGTMLNALGIDHQASL